MLDLLFDILWGVTKILAVFCLFMVLVTMLWYWLKSAATIIAARRTERSIDSGEFLDKIKDRLPPEAREPYRSDIAPE